VSSRENRDPAGNEKLLAAFVPIEPDGMLAIAERTGSRTVRK